MENNKKVMIVDDETDLRLQIEEFLESEGFTVFSANNGREAMNLMLHTSKLPDVILLDLDMPTQNGFCFWNEMNDHKDLCFIPTILISGSQLNPDQLIGIEAFLSKPFQLSELLVVIKDVLRKRNLVKEGFQNKSQDFETRI